MTFKASNLVLQSVPPNPPVYGLPQFWGYYTTDNQATVSENYYFNYSGTLPGGNGQFYLGDQIYCVCSDGNIELQVATIGTPNGSSVTTVAPPADIALGSITTAMLGANIVTAAKIANNTITATQIANGAITTTQINASAGIVGTQLSATAAIAGTQLAAAANIAGSQLAANAGIVGTQLAANTLTATELALSVPQVIRVPITSANFKTAFTAGLAMIPAAGAGTIIIVNSVTYTFNFLTAAYTGGGAIGLQYSTAAPVNAAGFAASATVAAADVTGLSAAGYETADGAMAIASAAQAVNQGVWFTVASANFATGSGTVVANISYQVITV
jgi:hypothetical protein